MEQLEGQICPNCGTPAIYLTETSTIICTNCHRELILGDANPETLWDDGTPDETPVVSTTLEYILNELLVEWEIQFTRKHKDYGENAHEELGVKAQYVDISRKIAKLKLALWYGQTLVGEQPREILLDLIGHCFLTIDLIDTVGDSDA